MWHSVHVYCEAPDELLSGCVSGLVRSLKQRALIDRFFFLRYWEKGFHVRLRFALAAGAEADTVRAEIGNRLCAFVSNLSSERSLDEATYQAIGAELVRLEAREASELRLAPNNFVVEEAYRPELDKYGGARGIEIAETLFDRSAECVLDLLPAVAGQRGRRLGLGLAMMLAGTRAFGVPRASLPRFLDRYHRVWRGYLSQAAAGGEFDTPPAERRAAAARARVRSLFDGPHGHTGPFRAWTEAVRTAAEDLARDADRVLPQVVAPGSASSAEAKRDFLLAQYLHVHNNRLGLLPAEECHLAWLGRSALEASA